MNQQVSDLRAYGSLDWEEITHRQDVRGPARVPERLGTGSATVRRV